MSRRQLLSSMTLALASLGGLIAFCYPFLLAALGIAPGRERGIEVSLLFALLAATALIVLLSELTGSSFARLDQARAIALLATLIAVDAALRFIPSFIGASPIFFLIIVSGTVFGARFGFLMGSLTLLVSAILTGGVGPWLPFQMLTAGWVGMTAGWLPAARGWKRRLLLALHGALWGFLFGALMNLWFWPFAAPGVTESGGLYWVPGMSLAETIAAYGRFYLATSLLFDGTRALGNALLALALGEPIAVVLERWRDRLLWRPWVPIGGCD